MIINFPAARDSIQRTGLFFQRIRPGRAKKSVNLHYMDKFRKQEYLLYALVWAIVIVMVPHWGVLAYLLLFLIHNFLLEPLLPKKKWLYLGLTLSLLTLFGIYCFQTGMRPPEFGTPPPPPDGFGTPPPEGFGPPDAPMGPPPDGHRPVKPEMMRLLLGILTIAVNLGVKSFFRARRGELRLKEMENERMQEKAENAKIPKTDEVLLFKTGHKTVRVSPGDIRYVESMSEYLKIHLDAREDPLVVLYSLKRLCEQLPEEKFVRIHRSYLVNLRHIKEAGKAAVTLDDGTALPVGDLYRAAFRERFK